MTFKASAFGLILSAAGLVTTAAAAPLQAAAAQVGSAPSPAVTNAWQRVVLAQTWMQQAHEVNGFLIALGQDGHRPADLTFDARNIALGRAVAADDPDLLQRPQAHEVTLTLDGRFYVFRPLSRVSIEPLLKR